MHPSIKHNVKEFTWIHTLLITIVVVIFILVPISGHSQNTSDVDPSFEKENKDMAPVRIEGNILFYVRGVSAFPAETRAKTISERIKKAAKDQSNSTDSVKAIVEEDHMQVFAGKEFIMNIYPVDAEAEGINIRLLADANKIKISQAIQAYRQDRSPAVINAGIWKAIVAFILSVMALFLFNWIFLRFKEGLKIRMKNRAEKVEKISFQLIHQDQMMGVLHVLYRLIRSFIFFVLILSCIEYILALFPWTKGIAAYILDLILDPLEQLGKNFINYLPKLFFLIVIFLITRYLLKLVKLFFQGLENGAIVIKSFYPEWAMPAFQILRFMIIVLTVVMAFPYIPFSDTSAFQGVSVFLGLILSLGSSSFISNIIAGYSLTFRRAFIKGDRILVNESLGTVEEQSLMSTRLRSTKNEEIVIPNSVLINSTVLNYTKKSRSPGIILHTTVGIGYDTPWRQVEVMLKLAAERTEGLLKDPPPFVLQRALGDFAITYEINVYCTDPGRILYYYTKLHQNILDVFNEYNVQIMTPNYVVDPAAPKVVPKENWNMPPSSEENAPN